MKVLITGGAGYIGGTIASMCLDHGIAPVVLDNLSTGDSHLTQGRIFYQGDIGDARLVTRILAEHPDIFAAIHCAGAIRGPESVTDPLRFYTENVAKSVTLLDTLTASGCSRIIVSSSAAVYAPADDLAVDESSPIQPPTPYGRSKAMLETIVHDRCRAGSGLRAIAFRYHNVVGADPNLRSGPTAGSGVLGRLLHSARTGEPFVIAGTDWPTTDGTGLRDYIHVWDVAHAHLLALSQFDSIRPTSGPTGLLTADLGSGTGTTVKDLIRAVQTVVGKRLAVHAEPRRPGDIAGCVSRSQRAAHSLGWKPQLPLAAAIHHAWQWQTTQPGMTVTDNQPNNPTLPLPSRALALAAPGTPLPACRCPAKDID